MAYSRRNRCAKFRTKIYDRALSIYYFILTNCITGEMVSVSSVRILYTTNLGNIFKDQGLKVVYKSYHLNFFDVFRNVRNI